MLELSEQTRERYRKVSKGISMSLSREGSVSLSLSLLSAEHTVGEQLEGKDLISIKVSEVSTPSFFWL